MDEQETITVTLSPRARQSLLELGKFIHEYAPSDWSAALTDDESLVNLSVIFTMLMHALPDKVEANLRCAATLVANRA